MARPKTDKPYRKNIVRVSSVEDTLLRILQTPSRSREQVIKDELEKLRVREIKKAAKKTVSAG